MRFSQRLVGQYRQHNQDQDPGNPSHAVTCPTPPDSG